MVTKEDSSKRVKIGVLGLIYAHYCIQNKQQAPIVWYRELYSISYKEKV